MLELHNNTSSIVGMGRYESIMYKLKVLFRMRSEKSKAFIKAKYVLIHFYLVLSTLSLVNQASKIGRRMTSVFVLQLMANKLHEMIMIFANSTKKYRVVSD